MSTFPTNSYEDLTIILPRSGVRGFPLSLKASRSSRSQILADEKARCLLGKRRRAPWFVISPIGVVAFLFVGSLAMAVRGTPLRHATPIVAQQKPPLEAILTPITQDWVAQTCSAQTTHGTAVNFVATPAEAARQARKDNKLTFLLHISGNFEDADFT